jgi:two-component system sensor histidine kinase KdpD
MTSEDKRPDPEVLLQRTREAERGDRGRLRIYLGAFPGVGKTYAMLNEAQRRRGYGEDVVVGYVETHGRKNTAALVEGLEIVPPHKIEYQGRTLEEVDVEAVLRRHPAVCLIDELAHTNAPGSERQKRYEDVDAILDAGIDVVATLNVQHLESLNDTVESITGIKVRETIPDFVLDDADEVILIDLSPEGARARMQHGHIYPPEQARLALERFFRPENLGALRELALRRTAEEVDEQLEGLMRDTKPAGLSEKVLALVDEKEESRVLIREAWRLAQGVHAELLVAYVERELRDEQRRELAKTLELAEDLNARVVPLTGPAIESIAALAKTEGIETIVLAAEGRGLLSRLLRPSIADQLARLPGLTLHLVGGRPTSAH